MLTQRAATCLCNCTGRLLVQHRPPALPRSLSLATLSHNQRTKLARDLSPQSSKKSAARIGSDDKSRALQLRFSALSERLDGNELKWTSEQRVMWRVMAAMSKENDNEDVEGKKKKETVVIIAGPTAVGKTRLALALAKRLGGEIISADSVQVYKGLDVGSAKTPVNEREGIPHHLIDIVDATEDYTAGRFYDDARAATELVVAKGAVPIVVGGTGMYLRWYMNGKVGAPKATKEVSKAVEEEVEHLMSGGGDWDAAVAMLAEAGDPTGAHSLARNDWYRLHRALEIIKASGQPRGAFPKSRNNGEGDAIWDYDFQCYFLYQPRPDLYRRIDLRCEQMVEEGMLEEASCLLDSGLQPNTNSATRAIGYQLAMEYLIECRASEGMTTEERFLLFLSAFQQASRNLVKRQLTWFRNEGQSEQLFNWIDATQPLDVMVEMLAKEYERPHGVTSELEGCSRTKEASYKEGKLLKVYQTKNRIFSCNMKACEHVLDWIRRTQTKPTQNV